jgi:predicted phosphodiesterase
LTDTLRTRIAREKPNAVIFGHTHKPFCKTIGGILYFNPSYAGRQRFDLPRGAAILHCDAKEIRAEFLPL